VFQFEETATGAKAQFHFYGRFGTTQVVPCYKAIQIEILLKVVPCYKAIQIETLLKVVPCYKAIQIETLLKF
jgi:hypothetical protein